MPKSRKKSISNKSSEINDYIKNKSKKNDSDNEEIASSKDIELLKVLDSFYYNKKTAKRFVKLIRKETTKKISRRVFDWFVTNYCKKKTIVYNAPLPNDSNSSTPFNVYNSYKEHLKAYTKNNFDPFNRSQTFSYTYNNNSDNVKTSIGQLNFFKWIIYYKVDKYIANNYAKIVKDMKKSTENQQKINDELYKIYSESSKKSGDRTDKQKKYRKPRQKLSKSNVGEVTSCNIDMEFTFE